MIISTNENIILRDVLGLVPSSSTLQTHNSCSNTNPQMATHNLGELYTLFFKSRMPTNYTSIQINAPESRAGREPVIEHFIINFNCKYLFLLFIWDIKSCGQSFMTSLLAGCCTISNKTV